MLLWLTIQATMTPTLPANAETAQYGICLAHEAIALDDGKFDIGKVGAAVAQRCSYQLRRAAVEVASRQGGDAAHQQAVIDDYEGQSVPRATVFVAQLRSRTPKR